MTASLTVAGSVAAATILAIAGVLKLRDERQLRWRLAGAGEVLLAGGLLVPITRSAALAATAAAATAFVVYALRSEESRPCRCFGARLRVFSRKARVARSAALLVLVAASLVSSLAQRGAEPTFMATSAVVGLAVGALVVVVPAAVSSIGTAPGAFVTKEDSYV